MPLGELLLRQLFGGKALRPQERREPPEVQLLAGPHRLGGVDAHLISTPNPRRTRRATTVLCTSSGPS